MSHSLFLRRRLALTRYAKAPAARAGFTLIELLVTVCIMCVLMAIILPHYLGGKDPVTGKKVVAPREKAQQVGDMEYVGQINQAIAMYKMDNDDHLPPNLDALKKYGVTEEMLRDQTTGRRLSYDPRTGVVGNSMGQSRGPDSLGGGQVQVPTAAATDSDD